MELRVSFVTSSHPSSVLKATGLVSDWLKYALGGDLIDQSEAEIEISELFLKEISSSLRVTDSIVRLLEDLLRFVLPKDICKYRVVIKKCHIATKALPLYFSG